MRVQLRAALTLALKAQDSVAVSALRSALAALENAGSVEVTQFSPAPYGGQTSSAHIAGSALGLGATEVERRTLTDAEVEQIVRTEVTERLSAAGSYAEMGRSDRAERLRAEADVLARYLPA